MKLIKKASFLLTGAYIALGNSLCFASSKIEQSSEYQSTIQLFKDGKKVIVYGGAILLIGVALYFNTRQGMADEMDEKKWKNRKYIAIGCIFALFILEKIVNIVLSYYNVSAIQS